MPGAELLYAKQHSFLLLTAGAKRSPCCFTSSKKFHRPITTQRLCHGAWSVALASRHFPLEIKTKRTEKEKNQEGECRPPEPGVHDMTLLCFFVYWKKTTRRRKKVLFHDNTHYKKQGKECRSKPHTLTEISRHS
jgi:hypothetical protein